MNKKLLGALLLTGAAAAIVATRDLWVPLVKAGGQEVLLWVMDDLEDEEVEDVVAAFEAGEKGLTGEY